MLPGLVSRRNCRLSDQPLPDGLQCRPHHPHSPLSVGAPRHSPGLPHSSRGRQGFPCRLLEPRQGEETGESVSSSGQHWSLPSQLLVNLQPGQGWEASSSLRSHCDPTADLSLHRVPRLRHDALLHRPDGHTHAAWSLQVAPLTLSTTLSTLYFSLQPWPPGSVLLRSAQLRGGESQGEEERIEVQDLSCQLCSVLFNSMIFIHFHLSDIS